MSVRDVVGKRRGESDIPCNYRIHGVKVTVFAQKTSCSHCMARRRMDRLLLSTPPMPDLIHHALLASIGWDQRFEMLEKIGAGAMGQVWRAREISSRGQKTGEDESEATSSDRIVALKILDPARTGDEQTLARLEIEGETLTKLRDAGQHEHVVPILDFKITDEHACLVMEFIPGLNLRKWCSTHQLSLQDRVRLISQVARASGWFHGLGIVHRDLKPANILVHATTHQPIIVDFSIAKVEDTLTLTLTNEALGTAPYMAPEQFDRRRGPISPASDVFSLGSTLYELLTQVHPHPGDFTQILQRFVDEVRPAPPSLLNPAVPRDLESIILKALSHRPSDRYADGTALADDLDRFLAGEPVKARPLPLTTRLLRRARRKPALTAALAACVVLSLLATWSIQRAGKERQQREIEARLAESLRASSWTRASLQNAEASLTALAINDPAKAAQQRQGMVADLIHDFENGLRQNALSPADISWMRDDALPWLTAQNHPQTSSLRDHLTERLGRWETVAQLRPPFLDLQGLFPRSKIQVQNGLLHALQGSYQSDDLESDAPPIRVLDDPPNPIETRLTFQGDVTRFKRLRLYYHFQALRLEVYLLPTQYISSQIRKVLAEKVPLAPDGYVLCTSRSKGIEKALHIPKLDLVSQGFTLSTRIENRRLTVDVDGQWSLSIEDLFAFTSAGSKNYFDIYWPPSLGLRELTLSTRALGSSGPMEQADLLYSQAAYGDAQRLYESLRSDPSLSAEAGYKLARCLEELGNKTAAHALWETISQGPPSAWQQLSTYPLWLTAAKRGGPPEASPYLARLPEREELTPQLKSYISSKEQFVIKKAYQRVGHGLNTLRRDMAALNEALKAFRIMGITAPETAVSLALPMHFAGLDDKSRELFKNGLAGPRVYVKDSTCQAAAEFVLDHWTRTSRSEKTADLRRALSEWCEVYPDNPTYRAISLQETARTHARAGKWDEALRSLQQAHENVKADARILTAGWLLEGMIHQQIEQPAQAQAAWQQAAQTATTVESRSALYLTDLILLYSAARTWTRESCTQVITEIMGRGKTGTAAHAARSLFISQFMIGDDFIGSLNGITETPEGRRFLRDAILRRITAREAAPQVYQLIMKSYFLSTAFTQPTVEQKTHVHHITGQLTEAIATLPEGEASLHRYFQTWATLPSSLDPQLFPADPRFAPLNAELKWLLAQRYRHLGNEETAKMLEQ